MHRSMRPVGTLSLAGVLVAGSVALAGVREARFSAGSWQRGETLYRRNCAGCHRTDLQGRGMAPSLLGVTRHMEDEQVVAHARRIGETMCCARHILRLTDAQFADIVAYFHAVDRDPGVRRRATRAAVGTGCCSR